MSIAAILGNDGIPFFLGIQVIGFFLIKLSQLIFNWRRKTIPEKQINLLQKSSFSFLLILIIYVLISYIFNISLVGHYTDFIIGTIILIYCDIIYYLLTEKSQLKDMYVKIRSIQVAYNIIRLTIFFAAGIFTTGTVPITFPFENTVRTKDVAIFHNSLHLNNSYYYSLKTGGYKQVFKVAAVYGIFEKRLLKLDYGPRSIDSTSYLGADTFWASPIYIINKGQDFYFHLDPRVSRVYVKKDTNILFKLN